MTLIAKMERRRIKLDTLEGSEESFLEIEPHENGDISVTFRGQDERGQFYTVRAQALGPFGGTRNRESYDILLQLYNQAGK
jgi:hypothetical protein